MNSRIPLAVGIVVGLTVFGIIMTYFLVEASNARLELHYEACRESEYPRVEYCEPLDKPSRETRWDKYIEYGSGGVLWGAVGGFMAGGVLSAAVGGMMRVVGGGKRV